MQIVDLFYELARQHKRVKGFYYGKSYNKGAGNAVYPLVWVDDPVYGRRVNQTMQYTVNVDVLGLPDTDADILNVQKEAFNVGITFEEKIKQTRGSTGFGADGLAFVSVSEYYDDNAAGMRFTFTITGANPVDRCNDDFDPDKKFPDGSVLPSFSTDNPDGCAVFADKSGLPNFKISNPDGCAVFSDE